MKFMVLIYSDETLLDGLEPGAFDTEMRGCLAKADELRQRGSLIDSQMLEGANTAKSLRVREGRATVTDGPFTETKEFLAGFNLIEAADMEAALAIAAQFPWAKTGCIEVRPVRDIATVRQRPGVRG
jgi:hypothetical protein